MTLDAIQVGDVVRLFSGPGPWLTVERLDGPLVHVSWVDAAERVVKSVVPVEDLVFGWRNRLGGVPGVGMT